MNFGHRVNFVRVCYSLRDAASRVAANAYATLHWRGVCGIRRAPALCRALRIPRGRFEATVFVQCYLSVG